MPLAAAQYRTPLECPFFGPEQGGAEEEMQL